MSGEQDQRDEEFMRLAIAEGRKGLGLTFPNPPVGAVITDGREIFGRGWHQKAGEAHAEVNAIRDVIERHGEAALRGKTIYVSLEPCSTEGRTPPCVNAILQAGFARVVIGCRDPNPAHAGSGISILNYEGVEVKSSVCEDEAKRLIRFFAKHITTGRPYVIAKTAMTLDGRTTLPPEMGQWISSPQSREDVQRLRRQIDAILVGGETLRVDNPKLTLRGEYAEGREQPLRVVLTAEKNLPEEHHLFTDEYSDRTEVHYGASLSKTLDKLGARGITSVLLESGGRLFSHGIANDLIDEAVFYIAPIIGGGSKRVMPGDGAMANLEDMFITRVGPDLKVSGLITKMEN